MKIPKTAKDIVGTVQSFSGDVFDDGVDMSPTDFLIKECKWSDDVFTDNGKEYPTVSFLLDEPWGNGQRWTKGFPVRGAVTGGDNKDKE